MLGKKDWPSSQSGAAVTGCRFLAGTAQAADFTKPITGNTDADYAGVKSGLTYTFTGDNTITPDTQYYQAGIDYSKYASGNTLTVNSTGKLSMNVSCEHQMMLDGIMNKSPNTMNINGDIDVKVNNTKDSGKSYGIYAWNTKGAKVDIIGNADISASAKNIAHGVDISSAGGWIDLEGKAAVPSELLQIRQQRIPLPYPLPAIPLG